MENIVVRQAKVEDAAGIAEIHVKGWQSAYKGQVPDAYLDSLSIKKRTEGWRDQIKSSEKDSFILVAINNDNIVGFSTGGKSKDEDSTQDTGEIYAIYAHPAFIGQGAGSKLMEYGLNLLKEDGYKKATLWVLTSNDKTRKWYEAKGWKVEGQTKIDKRGDFELHETRYEISL